MVIGLSGLQFMMVIGLSGVQIQSVIIQVINKMDDWEVGVQFVNHEYDYRQNWTTQSPVTN